MLEFLFGLLGGLLGNRDVWERVGRLKIRRSVRDVRRPGTVLGFRPGLPPVVVISTGRTPPLWPSTACVDLSDETPSSGRREQEIVDCAARLWTLVEAVQSADGR